MDQYTWKIWGDNYDRIESRFRPRVKTFWWGDNYDRIEPKFRVGPWGFWWGDNFDRIETKFRVGPWGFWWGKDMLREPTIDSFSVTTHVAALRDAVCRCASGDDPFDSEWKRAVFVYGRDSCARFWEPIYSDCAVGSLRLSLLNIIIDEAILGLHVLAIDLNGLFNLDVGWIFYLLETRLGETFKQIHEDFPPEGLNSFEAGYEPIGDITKLLKEARERLRQARDQVIGVIERIISSYEPAQCSQIFDISDGSQVNDEDWELHWDSQRLTHGDDHEGSHEVILRASQSEPAGLGEGYISWTASKGTTHLIGFSTLPLGIKLEVKQNHQAESEDESIRDGEDSSVEKCNGVLVRKKDTV